MRQRIINSSNIGKLTLLVGVLLLCPLATLPFYSDEADNAVFFLLPSAFSIVAGAALCLATAKKDFRPRQADRSGDMTVLFGWLYGFLAGAMPFFLSGRLSFVQSLFEAVSGWTTTGLSVMDVTTVPSIFLFHRSFMQFCGGLGFVMVMIVFMSGRQAMDLYSAEGHPDKIMPTLRETVRAIFLVYLASLAVGTAAYTACGMPVFDSILHTMGALSTGGFSNMVDSIGAYHSVAIEAVSIVLMIIGTTNFAVVLLFVRGRFRKAFRAGEVRFLGVLLVIFVPITALSLTAGLYMSFGEGLRQAIFNIVSALSTTGYSTMSYDNEELIRQMVAQQKDMKIPSELVPHCSLCGKPLTLNLRKDDGFVQDAGWYAAANRYEGFLREHEGQHILFLELGVGSNTPVIIKYPFWRMTAQNPKAVYACVNKGEAYCPDEIEKRSICIDANISQVLQDIQ